jgi:hypothetical protein
MDRDVINYLKVFTGSIDGDFELLEKSLTRRCGVTCFDRCAPGQGHTRLYSSG